MNRLLSFRFTAILAALGSLVSSSLALADDYRVEFGAETDAGKDAGALSCAFEDMCVGRLATWGLRIRVYLSHGEPGQATIYVDSDNPGCCYFQGGVGSTVVVPATLVSRLPLFKGARARGGLFIENERIGTLYFRFRFLSDKI